MPHAPQRTVSFEEKCRTNPQAVSLPESLDPRVLGAAAELLSRSSVSEVLLYAPRAKVQAAAEKSGITLPKSSKIKWISDELPQLADDVTGVLASHFQHRGKTVSEEELRKKAASPLVQAGYLLDKGHCAAAVAGCVAPTAEVIRAALATVGLAPGIKTVSGAFLMTRADAAYLYADSAVVIEPTEEQVADIAVSTVNTWRKLIPESEPVVAFLSFSTKGSAHHASAEKMAKAAATFKARCPGVAADGEMQFDAAFDANIGNRKCPGSPVPGKANCFIFANLDAGNTAYKITQRLGGFAAIGPILQGTRKPYSDLSRGASTADIVLTCYVSLLQATE